jgi:hypothetical protein
MHRHTRLPTSFLYLELWVPLKPQHMPRHNQNFPGKNTSNQNFPRKNTIKNEIIKNIRIPSKEQQSSNELWLVSGDQQKCGSAKIMHSYSTYMCYVVQYQYTSLIFC